MILKFAILKIVYFDLLYILLNKMITHGTQFS